MPHRRRQLSSGSPSPCGPLSPQVLPGACCRGHIPVRQGAPRGRQVGNYPPGPPRGQPAPARSAPGCRGASAPLPEAPPPPPPPTSVFAEIFPLPHSHSSLRPQFAAVLMPFPNPVVTEAPPLPPPCPAAALPCSQLTRAHWNPAEASGSFSQKLPVRAATLLLESGQANPTQRSSRRLRLRSSHKSSNVFSCEIRSLFLAKLVY